MPKWCAASASTGRAPGAALFVERKCHEAVESYSYRRCKRQTACCEQRSNAIQASLMLQEPASAFRPRSLPVSLIGLFPCAFSSYLARHVCCAWNDAHAVLLAGTGNPSPIPMRRPANRGRMGVSGHGSTSSAHRCLAAFHHCQHIVESWERRSFSRAQRVTDAFYDDPESDLRICHVDTVFPFWAPLWAGPSIGSTLVLFGPGTQRGAGKSRSANAPWRAMGTRRRG